MTYGDRDQARWVIEPPKRRARTAFARDRARVVHSAALRRLAAKTQVVEPLASARFSQHSPRTRLTHSLECAQIGRELGQALGADPDLVETACLAHDLGHPPFGHNGEAALDRVAGACGGFEGNAQSFRLLTRLEAKVLGPDGAPAGLNLTRATLDATVKYPWPRRAGDDRPAAADPLPGPGGDQVDDRVKYGVYAEDLPVFGWVRAGAPGRHRCFEAQVMDWADDVAYSVHDLEDGLFAEHISLTALRDPAERRELCELAAAAYCQAEPAELEEVCTGLIALPCWPASFGGGYSDLAALKNLTSELIGRFCRAAVRATREAHPAGPRRRYTADLVVPRRQRLECALLKSVATRYVMSGPGIEAARRTQQEIIEELAARLWHHGAGALDPAIRPAFTDATDDRGRLRVVVDQIAMLTDTSAVAWHRGRAG